MRHVTVERDDWTPWYERTKAELAQLAQAEIHVGNPGQRGGELLKIAAVHEFGATIHPRNAKNLAIPLSPRAEGRSPRDFDDLWTYDNGEDRFLVRDKGKAGLEFLYLLLPSVTIPERSFIRAGTTGTRTFWQRPARTRSAGWCWGADGRAGVPQHRHGGRGHDQEVHAHGAAGQGQYYPGQRAGEDHAPDTDRAAAGQYHI